MRYGDISYFQSGVAVPLFSLYSKQSIGIGEFLDLIPFARWAKFCDFNIIQLLPVNDTGAESSPYSARSAFALNPVFINVQTVEGSADVEDEIRTAKHEFDKLGKIDYYHISSWKRFVLRKIFDNRYSELKKDKLLQRWIDDNPWSKPYCVYCTLKAMNGEASWKDWPEFRDPSAKDIEKLWKKFDNF
jgi:4-alpha-glucanotransferase